MMLDAKNGGKRLGSNISTLLAAYRPTIITLASLVVTASLLVAPLPALADCKAAFEGASGLNAGFESLYDLDFDAAQARFSNWRAAYPDDPMGPTATASAYLFQEFDRLGVLQIELFRDDQAFQGRKKLTPDPRVKDLFDAELVLAEMLAARQLAGDAVSVNALLAATMIDGLRADYAALIDRRNGASLSYTKKGRRSAEKLLMLDTSCYDAYLALGVENYLLGSKPPPVRWILRAGGANTDREEGVRELELTAGRGHFLKPFAKLLLAVAALRRHDDQKAKLLLSELHREFPHNLLYEHELARLETEGIDR